MLIAGFAAGSFQANCYVVAAGPDRDCLVVDPGQDAAAALKDLLAEHRLRPVAVLLTHGHIDHVASAAEVCSRADIPAYLHDADAYMLDDPLAGVSAQLREALGELDLTNLRPSVVHPLTHTTELMLADLTLAVDHTPGHTGGSVVFRLAAGKEHPEILLTGDTLFAGSIGRTDLSGGSTREIMKSLRTRLMTRPDDAVVLPGHGPTSTIGAERVGNPFLMAPSIPH